MIFILMQIKLIFTWKFLHLASFWMWEFLELGNGLFSQGLTVLFPIVVRNKFQRSKPLLRLVTNDDPPLIYSSSIFTYRFD